MQLGLCIPASSVYIFIRILNGPVWSSWRLFASRLRSMDAEDMARLLLAPLRCNEFSTVWFLNIFAGAVTTYRTGCRAPQHDGSQSPRPASWLQLKSKYMWIPGPHNHLSIDGTELMIHWSYTRSTAQGGGGSFRRGNLQERLVVVNHGWQGESTDWPKGGWICVCWSGCDGCSGHLTHNCWIECGVVQL